MTVTHVETIPKRREKEKNYRGEREEICFNLSFLIPWVFQIKGHLKNTISDEFHMNPISGKVKHVGFHFPGLEKAQN